MIGDLVDPGVPVPLDEVEDPAHDRPPWQAATEDQATQRHQPGRRIHPLLQPRILDGNRPAATGALPGPWSKRVNVVLEATSLFRSPTATVASLSLLIRMRRTGAGAQQLNRGRFWFSDSG